MPYCVFQTLIVIIPHTAIRKANAPYTYMAMCKSPAEVMMGKVNMLMTTGMWLVTLTIPADTALISVGKSSPFKWASLVDEGYPSSKHSQWGLYHKSKSSQLIILLPFKICNTGIRPSDMQTGGIIEMARKHQLRRPLLSMVFGPKWWNKPTVVVVRGLL